MVSEEGEKRGLWEDWGGGGRTKRDRQRQRERGERKREWEERERVRAEKRLNLRPRVLTKGKKGSRGENLPLVVGTGRNGTGRGWGVEWREVGGGGREREKRRQC